MVVNVPGDPGRRRSPDLIGERDATVGQLPPLRCASQRVLVAPRQAQRRCRVSVVDVGEVRVGGGDVGAVYFDPYGQGFQQHWQHFTGGINELNLNETQLQELLGAASEMFTYVQTLGGEILPVSSDN